MTFNRVFAAAMACAVAAWCIDASRADTQQADMATTAPTTMTASATATAPTTQPAPLPDCLTDDERLLAQQLDQRVVQLLALLGAKPNPDTMVIQAPVLPDHFPPPGSNELIPDTKDGADQNATLVALFSQLEGDFVPREFGDQHAARAALLAMHDAFAMSLIRHLDDDANAKPAATAEIRARITDTLAKTARQTREAVMLSCLSADQREALEELRRLQPRLHADALSNDLDRRRTAIKALADKNIPLAQAEPLLILTLQSEQWWQLRPVVIETIHIGKYRSNELEDTLVHLAFQSPWFNKGACGLLRSWKSTRVTPRLLAVMKRNNARSDNTPSGVLVELLADLNDPRAIPVLMAMFEEASTKVERTATLGEKTYTLSNADAPLYLLIRLTGQSPDDYNVTPMAEYYHEAMRQWGGWDGWVTDETYGFLAGPSRQEAIDKFKAWYAKNKGRYANLPAMELPDADARPRYFVMNSWAWAGKRFGLEQSLASRTDVPATLCEAIEQAVAKIVPDLDAASPAARTRAQDRLLVLHDRLTAPLIDAARGQTDHDDPGARFLLQYMAALSEGLSHAATLDGPAREKLLRFRAEQGWLFRLYFSMDDSNQDVALSQLAHVKDPDANAEPLVVLALRSENSEIFQQACRIITTKKYRGPQIVDRLCKAVATGKMDRHAEYAAAKVLGVLNDPNTTPLLLERLRERASPADSWYVMGGRLAAVYSDAMVAMQDRRLIPVLVERLSQDSKISNLNSTRTMTYCVNDYYLYILLRLTGQSPEDYQLLPAGRNVVLPESDDAPPGFLEEANTDKNARAAAYEKMQQWWAEHKDQPPYKDLEPLPTAE
ncbi:MAG: hypothetical protein FWE88_03845 [Phycisphaerae bacterium]|nr:hypothetical protein [Phycisphaerae bacterium]